MTTLLNTACPDWADRLQRREVPISSHLLPMKTTAAERFSRVFGNQIVPDIEGTPRARDTPTQHWLDSVARALYGGPEVREALVLVPKKSAKTGGGALMYLSAFLINRIPQQRYTILAPTISVADFAFSQICGAIEADPALDAKCRIRRHTREVEHLVTHSTIAVKSATLAAATGLKGSVFVDELHIWGKMREGQKLRQQLRGALAASPHAKGLYITTQSDSEPEGLFANMLNYARMIRDGKISDPSFLPVLYEPWPGCEPWDDETVWPSLLPAYPHIADRAFYLTTISESNASGTTAKAEAKSQYFNIQIGHGEAGESWIVAERFQHLTEPMSLDELVEQSVRLSIGIDLGGAQDLTSLAVLGVDDRNVWRVWSRSWLTPAGWAHNEARNEARFTGYKDAGDLNVKLSGQDLSEMVGICEAMRESGKLNGVGVDPAGAADLVDALEDAGFIMEEDLHGIGQSAFRLAPAVRTLERRAEQGRVIFAYQPIMGWCLGNVVVKQKGNAPSINKADALEKIDPVAALLDAVSVEINHREEPLDATSMVG